MDEKLRSLLEELQGAIARSEADGVIDDDERAELRALLDRLGVALGDQPADDEGLTDAMEEAAVRFEARHPTITAVIRSAVDTLTGYGM